MSHEQRDALLRWRQQLRQLGALLQQHSQAEQWLALARVDQQLAQCLQSLQGQSILRVQLADELAWLQQCHQDARQCCAAAQRVVTQEMDRFNQCREGALAYQESELWR